MEHFNLRKEVLERHIKKTGILHPVEEYNNLSEEEREISRKFWEGKKSLPREIDDFTHVVNQKEDDLDFLEEKLKKIESKEVEILKAEALVKETKKEINAYKNEFFPGDEEYQKIQSKILELRKQLNLLELKIDDAEDTIEHFPGEILNYEQELDEDYKKLDLFDKQTENKEQN